jgi:hypothetical protein
VGTAKKIKGELTSDPGPLAKLLDPLRLSSSSRKIGLSNFAISAEPKFSRALSISLIEPDFSALEPERVEQFPS